MNEDPGAGVLVRVRASTVSLDEAVAQLAGDPALIAAVRHSQELGMLGARAVEDVVAHSTAYLGPLSAVPAGSLVVDLGSGGGVPGLIIAVARPDLRLALVDRRSTRADHLQRLVHRLGFADSVEVLAMDAAAAAGRLGPTASAITARGFGAPPILLRASAALLAPDGLLIASEPPTPDDRRWAADLLRAHQLTKVAWPDPRIVVLRRSRFT